MWFTLVQGSPVFDPRKMVTPSLFSSLASSCLVVYPSPKRGSGLRLHAGSAESSEWNSETAKRVVSHASYSPNPPMTPVMNLFTAHNLSFMLDWVSTKKRTSASSM